ncbi:MAG: arylsulfatase [Planctomycetota bacterium]
MIIAKRLIQTPRKTTLPLSWPVNVLLLICITWMPTREHLQAAERSVPAERPHIVIVLVDDLGYGDLSSFNANSKIATPALDAFALQSMRLTDAHAPGPLCHMSRYGLMTGQYPFRIDVNRWKEHALIGAEQTTIASLCREAGYRTAMVGKWHLGFEENGYDQVLPGGPVDVGFDSFFGIRASTDIPPYFYIRGDRAVEPPTEQIDANASPNWSPIQGEFWRAGGIAPNLDLHDVLPTFADEATRIIDEHAGAQTAQPLMLYVALPAPHTPWLPSELYLNSSRVPLYGDFVAMVDGVVGQILDRLQQHDMDDNALVIFSSDNGPVWYDEDVQRTGHDSDGPWRGMKADAWEAGHRMPTIVRWPNRIEPGSTSNQLICFTDFLATFADLFGIGIADDANVDSISFLPALLNRDNAPTQERQQWVMRSGRGHYVVRDGDWKWIDRLGSGGFSKPNRIAATAGGPKSQLYDLSVDPGEQKNLADRMPEKVKAMQAILIATIGETQ